MKIWLRLVMASIMAAALVPGAWGLLAQRETPAERDARMRWWREARFGMFIHWGLYSIPAGEWNGRTDHAEWIRTTARIPLAEYDRFAGRFNPLKFDAEAWARTARAAGMKYIVITSKHHDGFCLFDSKYTDFDIASTPFRRDVLKELADACRRQGIRICWYHSIMDWHEPDYLPRRDWEKDRRAQGADFTRYVAHMKDQLRELLTNYGDIGVLWFDGEWESTWNRDYGRDLYAYVRSLQPGIIVNNRVGAARNGMQGLTREGEFGGDFGTPEQEVPATGIPGADWESCITMNDHWGYNRNDHNWKSAKDLVRMLADVASKGGNLLLNVGPTAEGLFPPESLERLAEIGRWMDRNGEAIYATQASPFRKLDWGRCTSKAIAGGTRLYLHVFDWPRDGKIEVPGICNAPRGAYLLADSEKAALPVTRREDVLAIGVPAEAPDAIDSVVVLDVDGRADVNEPPRITGRTGIFVRSLEVTVTSDRENVQVRCTLDGSDPDARATLARGRITLTKTTTVAARCFRDGKPVSGIARASFSKIEPRTPAAVGNPENGLRYAYFEGDWNALPDFRGLTPAVEGLSAGFDLTPRRRPEYFGVEYTGYIRVPEDDVYEFFIESDDGSRLYIGDALVVDNDGLNGLQERRGVVALGAGLHPIRVAYFNRTGGLGLGVFFASTKFTRQPVPASALFRRSR